MTHRFAPQQTQQGFDADAKRLRKGRVKLSNHFCFVLQSLLAQLSGIGIEPGDRLLSSM